MTEIITQPQSESNIYLLEKRYELLLDMNNKRLMKEITELRESIKTLETEIQTLKSFQKEAIQKNSLMPTEQKPANKVAEIKSIDSNSNKELTSEEVSIEKYFYFGKK